MKNTRAVIPIGTILLIAVVIIAGFGIWWYFTQQIDCDDVEHIYTDQPMTDSEKWRIAGHWQPYVLHNDERVLWRIFFVNNDGVGGTYDATTLSQIENAIDSLNTDDDSKNRLHHIIDCIRADCPGCQEA